MFQLDYNSLLDIICMMAVFLLAIYNYSCMHNNKKGTGEFFFVIFILLFSLFYRPEGGDFWGYLEDYELGVNQTYRHMEPFYYWLMGLIPNNYLLWRIAIWLPAAIIIAFINKLLTIPSNIATVCFLSFALLNAYYYTRNALALSVLYLGMAILAQKGHFAQKTMHFILFAGLAFVSWFLHRSMPLYIGIALMSVVLPFNKKYILGAIIAFPLLYGSIYLISSNLLGVAQLWLADETGEFYLEQQNLFSANWKGIVSLIIGYLPIVYFYFIAFRKPLSQDNPDFNRFKLFLLLAFFLFFISFLFLGQGSDALQGRIYKSSMMPFAFTVGLYFKHYSGSRHCKAFVSLFVISIVWKLFVATATSL